MCPVGEQPCHCAFVAIESISVSGEFNRKSSARGRSATLVGDSSVSGLEIYFPEEAFPDVAEFVPGCVWTVSPTLLIYYTSNGPFLCLFFVSACGVGLG
mgnify:CR=1 FL=1